MSKSGVTLAEAKAQCKALIGSLNETDKMEFLEFTFKELTSYDSYTDDDKIGQQALDKDLLDDPVAKLNDIADEIKKRIPFNAVLPSEIITSPETGENSDCLPDFTVHVDDFLYDEDEVDKLVYDGKLKQHYCKNCGSKNVEPLIFISHSLSRNALYEIFSLRLPTLEEKTVLDVGSRLGAVLYGAYVFTDAKRIIGVEMNEDFCKLQNDVVKKYKMQDRVEIHHNRIEETEHLIEQADIIVINNAFEFYNTEEKQVQIWEFLRNKIKKGTILVVSPPLETAFINLKPNIVLSEWVKHYDQTDACSGDYSGAIKTDRMTDITIYQVL